MRLYQNCLVVVQCMEMNIVPVNTRPHVCIFSDLRKTKNKTVKKKIEINVRFEILPFIDFYHLKEASNCLMLIRKYSAS